MSTRLDDLAAMTREHNAHSAAMLGRYDDSLPSSPSGSSASSAGWT